MNICMLVYNSVTRDSRVMREAATLQAAGHRVTVVGVPDDEADAAVETAELGVTIHRVHWLEDARRKLRVTTPLRILPTLVAVVLILGGFAYLLVSQGPWADVAALILWPVPFLSMRQLIVKRERREKSTSA